jgi:phage recombination protein Bet
MSETTLQFTDAEMKVLKEKNQKLTPVEFDAFLSACKRYQLNPLANQIYARVQPATPKNQKQVTYCAQIDGYRLLADRTQMYAGNDDPVYDDDTNQPKKATVTVYKLVGGVRCPFTATARWSQYCPGGNQAFMWTKMPHLMLGKCAEALALRKAFPAELAGLYTLEEMHQAGVEEPVEQLPADTKPTAPPSKKPTPPPAPKSEAKQPAIAPPKRSDAEACVTPDELDALLKRWEGEWPFAGNEKMWGGIYTNCMKLIKERTGDGSWDSEAAAEALSEGALNNIKTRLDLYKQSKELISG